ncbi:hypothetical protein CsSME_00034024 [Camellia sinensis var. sinensis]
MVQPRAVRGLLLVEELSEINGANGLEAEFWALRDGLNLAFDKGYRNIEVETDSLLVPVTAAGSPSD